MSTRPMECGYCGLDHPSADPCPETDQETICERLAERLTERGTPATAEQTGGNIWCVAIPEPSRPGTQWLFGTANENWGGCLCSLTNEIEDDTALDTDVSSGSTDITVLADAITEALDVWRPSAPRRGNLADDLASAKLDLDDLLRNATSWRAALVGIEGDITAVVKALQVLVLDPRVRTFLAANDPKALEQATAALLGVGVQAAPDAE